MARLLRVQLSVGAHLGGNVSPPIGLHRAAATALCPLVWPVV
jgi:hypothetical protein